MTKVILSIILTICLFNGIKSSSSDTYNSTEYINELSCLPTLVWGSHLALGQPPDIQTYYQTITLNKFWSSLKKAWKDDSSPLIPPKTIIVYFDEECQNQDTLEDTFKKASSQLAMPNFIITKNDMTYFASDILNNPDIYSQVHVYTSSDKDINELSQKSFELKEENDNYMILYIPLNSQIINSQSLKNEKRRILLADDDIDDPNSSLGSNYAICDDLCMTHVKFLEAIVLALLLAIGFSIGLCCMNILDTPSRFEKADEAAE